MCQMQYTKIDALQLLVAGRLHRSQGNVQRGAACRVTYRMAEVEHPHVLCGSEAQVGPQLRGQGGIGACKHQANTMSAVRCREQCTTQN